jgi:hypothetical protein
MQVFIKKFNDYVCVSTIHYTYKDPASSSSLENYEKNMIFSSSKSFPLTKSLHTTLYPFTFLTHELNMASGRGYKRGMCVIFISNGFCVSRTRPQWIDFFMLTVQSFIIIWELFLSSLLQSSGPFEQLRLSALT